MQLGKIPLVIGMPVLVSPNFDVKGGIVNGSTRILKKVRYTVNDKKQRVLRSCIVEINQLSDEALPNLHPHDIPIIEDSMELRFMHPNSKRCAGLHAHRFPFFQVS
ncbi:hypothetical protein DFJ58DRAFT_663158 [Suillus subalutaceus]|uniref:uncharacterized protein n=1 Tax=Suillus subalutaceus TaxID=48586 RepID=UPI001B87E7FF|nr:uncharacterized protein DFJ58DRAFT_663158 [Suillus subalutaceus]KAG1847642.1 hypothetical protein DFJ58DRAFT_663158 [Suillus subalutaceus]